MRPPPSYTSHAAQMRCAGPSRAAAPSSGGFGGFGHETRHDDAAPPPPLPTGGDGYGPSRPARATRLEPRSRRPAGASEGGASLPPPAPLPAPDALGSSAVRPARPLARRGVGATRYAAADSAIATAISRQQSRMYSYEPDVPTTLDDL